MRYTENLDLKLPDDNDAYDQEHMNYNMEIVDKKINGLIPYWGTYETFPRPPEEDDMDKIFIDVSTNDPRLMYTWNKVDNEYAPTGGSGKADGSSVDIPLTLPAACWTGDASPYSQVVTVPQMRVGMTPFLMLTDSDTLTDNERYAFSLLTDYNTAYAQMTFHAADLPVVDIPITLKGIPAQEMEFVDNTVVLIVEPSGFTASTDPEYKGRYVSTITVEGMSAGAEGGSWDIVRSGPVLTLEESEIAAHITDVKCIDGAVQIICTKPPADRYLLKLIGTYADATPGDVILPNIQGYLDKVDELESKITHLEKSQIEKAIIVPANSNVADVVLGEITKRSSWGFSFVGVSVGGDIPTNFDYATGFVVHTGNTLSITLFSRRNSNVAINSYSGTEWTGWRIV